MPSKIIIINGDLVMSLIFVQVIKGLENSYTIQLYSETTWAVGIAQLTHHEVQGGGKNPETGGRGIFAPTADRVVS